jgi:transglutaminase-like putative cysteine protease
MVSPEKRGRRENWPMTGALALALVVAVTGLSSALAGWDWWLMAVTASLLALATTALLRRVTRSLILPALGGVAAVLLLMVVRFGADTAILGLIPTPGTFERFDQLIQIGRLTIAEEIAPAEADEGMLLIIGLGIGLLAVAMDLFAITLRAPALTGLPLLAVVAIPSIVQAELTSAMTFAATAGAWLLVLWVDKRRPQASSAIAVGAAVVAASLIVAPVLGGLRPESTRPGAAPGLQVGVNPLVNLGQDLRRSDPVFALRYTTSRESGQYLRMVTLDSFEGLDWEPAGVIPDRDNTVDAIASPPGLSDDVVREDVTTAIQVDAIVGRWLPVPYPPSSVTGLEGDWYWEPDGLAIRADNSYIRWQEYEVQSDWIRPTADQLLAAGATVPEDVAQFTTLPEGVPENIVQVTQEVTGAATTSYEKAIALQDYFRDGDFQYSEDAPVEDGYDGNGIDVISKFLEAKSGYCVHFSSAMAVMARVAGIPARVAVGFLPGELITDEETREQYYAVTSHDMHAWPELYFDQVGWVPFEPTPGRGVVPNYEAPVVDDPATPNVDESRPVPESGAVPSATPRNPNLPPDEDIAIGGPQAVDWRPTMWAVGMIAAALLVIFAPASWRRSVRSRRLLSRNPEKVWQELRDTAIDFGIGSADTETPRAFASRLAAIGELRGEQLDRLRQAVEEHSYGATPADVQVSIADAREVLARLEAGHGPRTRLLALLLPASLLPNFARRLVPA